MEDLDKLIESGLERYQHTALDLTQDQFLAIYLYCAELGTPQGGLWELLKKDLLTGEESAMGKWRPFVGHLNEACKKLPLWKYTKELHRGVDADLLALYPERYLPGTSLTWYSWTSAASRLKVVRSALPETKSRKTIFTVNAFSGRVITDVTGTVEDEVLLPPGSTFEVQSVSTNSDGNVMVLLKQVPAVENGFEGTAEMKPVLSENVFEGGLRPGEVEFLSGYELLLKSQFYNSLLYFEQAAEHNHFLSLVFLSYLYSNGGYVGFKNTIKSEYYLNEAEKHFSDQFTHSTQSYVQNGVGLYYFLKEDYDRAVIYFEKGANQNDAFAQCRLGYCYETGKGVSASDEKAVQLYKRSAKQGNAVAQSNCGLCYFKGTGVNVNFKKAMKLLKKSAAQGISSAQNSLGYCYLNGVGRALNLKKAVQLFESGASKGDVDSLCSLGYCYEIGKGVEMDLGRAIQYYQKGAEIGHSISECNLGSCYENGRGVDVDVKKAFQLYQTSANHNNGRAICCLGMCYEYGRGANADMDKAFQLYEQSANLGDSCGQFNLGVCYEYGRGVATDLVKARKLYKMGAKQGNTDAKKAFKKLKSII
eukprot:TRINITY_DN746_c0_g1_i2.p1 TRINITY_DN746_c0_g1~~TRINITY_DN746_c0_g1_i2.p1  ORF type:complete len:662 (+),score=130.97 TRINITY_DN746_c0_g1_i2:219-1988(+)